MSSHRQNVYRVPARISVSWAPIQRARVLAPSRRPQSVWRFADGTREYMYAIECIQASMKSNGMTQYLVKWVGYSEDESTWLCRQHLVDQGSQHLVEEFDQH